MRPAYLVAAAAVAALFVGVPFAGGDPPPVPTITSSPSSITKSTNATFEFTDADVVASLECSLDGSAFTSCSSPAGYTKLADGSHTFQVRAVDGDPSGTASVTWQVDTVPPPAPRITATPAVISNDSTPAFEFVDDEAGVTFDCRLTSGAFPPCTSPKTYPPLPDGSYTFFVKAVDAADNESDSARYAWTIDTRPPLPPTITEGPPNPSNSILATFGFNAEAGASFLCSLDGGSFSSCSNPASVTVGDGGHTFAAEAVDAARNVSAPSKTYSWVVDTVHPLVGLTSKPALITNQTSASFAFSATGSVDHYECRLDAGAFALCASPLLYSALKDGEHTFAVRAVSVGGTAGAATTYTWTVDTVPPQTTIASAPPSTSTSASAAFSFTSSESGSTFVCSINSGGFTPCIIRPKCSIGWPPRGSTR